MPRSTITGQQIRDGEVNIEDLAGESVTEDKIVDGAAVTNRLRDLHVTNAKLNLRDIPTDKLAEDYVKDNDTADIGGESLRVRPTIGVETFHIAVEESAESAPSLATDGIPLDGASHVTWALAEPNFTTASFQGWLYTTALGWMEVPGLSNTMASGALFSDTLEVSGAERFALQIDTLTGTTPSLLKILKAVTT